MTCGTTLSCGEVLVQILIFGLSNGAILALNAIAFTLLYGTIRTLNLAHGDVFALASTLTTTLITVLGVQPDWPAPNLIATLLFVLLMTMLFGAGLNVLIERAAFGPFRGRSTLAPLIATLGLSFVLYQAALIWRTTLPSWLPGDHRSVPGLPEVPLDRIPDLLPGINLVQWLGLNADVTFRFADLFVLLVALVCAFGLYVFMQRTPTGRAFRAVAQQPQLAQMCGVNLNGTIRSAFALSGALAGAAAFVFALYYGRPFGSHGAQSGLLAFTAAILGGVGSPGGALASGLLLGVGSAYSDYFLLAQWTPVLTQLLLIVLLVLRPGGLSGDEQKDDWLTGEKGGLRGAVTLLGPGQRPRPNRWLVWGVAALALSLPLLDAVFGQQYQVLAMGIGILVVLALGLNLVLGVAGILDLGFAVSFGIGGYLTGLLTGSGGALSGWLPRPLDFVALAALSGLLAGMFGALKGQLTLRLRSDYLAVVTLALGLLARRVLINLNDLTGGTGGLPALPPPHIVFITFSHPTAQYYLVLGVIAFVALVSQRLIDSKVGRAWLAGSEDEAAAASLGVDVARSKSLAMIASSAVAGLAGALYAATFSYVSPEMVDFHISAMILAMVILGGAGSVPGVILGATLIASYDRFFIPRLGEWLALLQPAALHIGAAPDIRGLSYFNFGIALYASMLWRARREPLEAKE